jgi:membrane protease YdiL (CAAX protease family)
MRFLSKISEGRNDFASYALTICLVIFSYGFLGSLPLLIDLRLSGTSFDEMMSIEHMTRILGKNRLLIHLLLPFFFIFGSLLLGIKYFHKRSIRSFFTSDASFRWKRFFTTFFLWWVIMTLFLVISFQTSSDLKWNFNWSNFWPLLLISFAMIPIQTTAEELFFRGYLAKAFYQKTGSVLHTILITSILFASMHAFNPEVDTLGYGILVYYFVTAVFLAIMTAMDNGMELSMGYHAANNVFTAIMITNNWQAFQTDAVFIDTSTPIFGIDSILTLVIVQPLFLLLLSKIYKWNNWKLLVK